MRALPPDAALALLRTAQESLEHGAASGLSVLAPTAQATLLSAADAPPSAGAVPPIPAAELPAGLTPREAEILTLIARGLTNPEITARLVLSSHTIKTHISRIFAKTGSANRTEAVRSARAHGPAGPLGPGR